MDPLERCFDATVFTKNRQWLLAHDAGWALFDDVVWTADAAGHFSMSGALIEAVANLKSLSQGQTVRQV